jgi:3-oxo-5-alpha-steroid 4-dehydrogenase 1
METHFLMEKPCHKVTLCCMKGYKRKHQRSTMILNTLYVIFFLIEIGSSGVIFILLLVISAPYGKHYRHGWGTVILSRTAWIFMESPAFFVILILFIAGKSYTHAITLIFILLWQMHYIQRTFIYPFLLTRNKKNFPVIIAAMGFIFNIINGYINGYYLFFIYPHYPLSWLIDVRFITGFIIFITGFAINLHSDKILRELKSEADNSYKIPHRGLYRIISSPNYFGEIIEWIGWALLTWSPPGLVFALFTIANLLPRALSHHRWYRKTFPDYPRERKAIIPFLL